MNKFDLVVIGAGPSGYAAAMRALDFKKKILLVERERVGGAGVTNGALSSKTWWELSRENAAFLRSLRMFNIKAPAVSYTEIQAEVRRAVKERLDLLEEHMEALKKSNYSDLLSFRKGSARIIGNHEVEITEGGRKEVVHAENIILATGSRPRQLPELPIDEKVVMTSEGIESMSHFP